MTNGLIGKGPGFKSVDADQVEDRRGSRWTTARLVMTDDRAADGGKYGSGGHRDEEGLSRFPPAHRIPTS